MIEILIAITASVGAFLCGWHYNDFKKIFGKKAKRIKRETNHIQQCECFTSVDKINFNSNKKATLYSKPETFPQYLERVGAIKPKFVLSEELKAKYGSFGDIPRPTRHKSEKDILERFDIDIAKTREEAENEIKKTEAFWLSKSDKTITIKRPSHETFPLDKNGNGGC